MERQQTNLGLIGYFFIGTAGVLIPSVMPSITDEFMAIGLTLAVIGLLFPARSMGGLLGNLIAGIGSDRMGRGQLVWLSALLVAVTMALAAFAQLWLLFVVAFILVSTTQSALSTGINAMVADANREARGRALNLLHGVYGIGAAVSPLIFGYLLERGLPWRWALGGTGLIWLLYALGVYGFGREEQTGPREVKTQKVEWGMLRQGPFLALFVIAFVYNGVAYSLLNWIAIFMQQSAGFSTFLSISMISVFYVALTVGRFLCAAFAERFGYAIILLVLAFGITFTYPLVLLPNPWLVVAGVFLTGLSLSGLFPMSLAYGARLYPEQTGTFMGTLNVAMSLGAMIPPLWTGAIADVWGFQTALGVNYIMAPLLIFMAFYLSRLEIRPSAAQTASGTAR